MAGETKYTPELWEELLDHLFSGGTAVEFARRIGITYRTLRNWADKDDAHQAQYKTAMEAGAGVLVDQVVAIADDRQDDADAASRRVRAWARLEVAKRKAPHLYGDRVQHANDPENPMPSAGMTGREIEERIHELLAKGQGDEGAE